MADLLYDNQPTGTKRCSIAGCGLRARWWVDKGRCFNLCDEHFAISLRKDAGLTRLRVRTTSEVTGSA